MRRILALVTAALALPLVPALPASADIVRFTFEGTLDTVEQNDNGILGAVGNGTAFSGTFWYDTDYTDNDTESGRNGEYLFDEIDDAGIEVTIAGNDYGFEGDNILVRVRNYPDADYFQFTAGEFGSVQSGSHRFWDFGLALTDSDASAFNSDNLPATLNGSRFNTRRFRMLGESRSNADTDFWVEGAVTSIAPYQEPPPPPGVVRGDFNGDGKADLVFRNTATGRNVVWRMNGATRQSFSQTAGLGNLAWKARGNFDFDGDDDSDIVWRNVSNGANAVWRMNGSTFVESVTLPTLRGAHWLLSGVGDFDKDGGLDMLWRNSVNGSNRVWRLDGTSLLTNTQLPGLRNQNWRVGGVDDFDGNGGSDILWRNKNTGEIAIWIMNALWRQSVVSLGNVLPIAWEVAGVGDYDGDGVLEVLFLNPHTGAAKMAFLGGTNDLTVSQIIDVDPAVTRGWVGSGHEMGVGAGGAAARRASAGFAARQSLAYTAVPEPTAAALLLAGAALLLTRRRQVL